MTDTPPDWVLIEAAKRAGLNRTPAQLRAGQIANAAKPYFRALCDMILKHEQPPVDRKVLCALAAWDDWVNNEDEHDEEWIGLRAIELWESGYGS